MHHHRQSPRNIIIINPRKRRIKHPKPHNTPIRNIQLQSHLRRKSMPIPHLIGQKHIKIIKLNPHSRHTKPTSNSHRRHHLMIISITKKIKRHTHIKKLRRNS